MSAISKDGIRGKPERGERRDRDADESAVVIADAADDTAEAAWRGRTIPHGSLSALHGGG